MDTLIRSYCCTSELININRFVVNTGPATNPAGGTILRRILVESF